MKYFLVILLMVASLSYAENFPTSYTEPAAQSGTLVETCIWACWCVQSSNCNCKNLKKMVCTASDDGNGGDAKTPAFNVPINEDDLPITVKYCATSVNTSGNETSKADVCSTKTISAAP